MTERKRIDNPTCETCKWYWIGECKLNAPVVGFNDCGDAIQARPEVHREDFCSHHESAFEEQSENADTYIQDLMSLVKPIGATST